MTFDTIDDRRRRTEIAQRKFTITATAAKSGSTTLLINGELLNYIIVAPDLATDASYNLTLTNSDGVGIYVNTGISDNCTTRVLLSANPLPLSDMITFECSFATSQTAEFTVYVYYK